MPRIVDLGWGCLGLVENRLVENPCGLAVFPLWKIPEDTVYWRGMDFGLIDLAWGQSPWTLSKFCPHRPCMRKIPMRTEQTLSSWTLYMDNFHGHGADFVLMDPVWGQSP